MLHVHVAKETIDARPWLGVLIGLVGIGLFGTGCVVFAREYLALAGTGKPRDVTIEQAALPAGRPRAWVTLTSGVWHPELALQEHNEPPESWVFGKVSGTQVPVTDKRGRRLIVLDIPGAPDLASLQGRPVEGVLCRDGDSVWGCDVDESHKRGAPETVMVLSVGAGPSKALLYALFFGAMGCLDLWLTSYYWRMWRGRRLWRRRQQLAQR